MSANSKSIAIIALIVAIVAVLVWRWRAHESVLTTEKPATAAATERPKAANDEDTPGNTPPGSPATPAPPTQKPSPELRRTFETLNHNEIQFYGRAVDQFGEPVAAADVEGAVLVNTGSRGGQMRRQTTTDAQGYFQFGGFKGQDLGITITKNGYEYRRKSSSFSYSYFEADHKRHIPDPKNPVVFVLWKRQGAEALVHYRKTFREFPADGTPVGLDLATGRLVKDRADVVINVIRTPLKMRAGEIGYQWKTTITALSGGVIKAGEKDYYNAAPDSGYAPQFEHIQEAQSVRDAQAERIKWTWKDSVTETLFIKSRDGQRYARVEFSIYPGGRADNDTVGSVGIRVWLNPNGSRNLEFDPAKAIKPTP